MYVGASSRAGLSCEKCDAFLECCKECEKRAAGEETAKVEFFDSAAKTLLGRKTTETQFDRFRALTFQREAFLRPPITHSASIMLFIIHAYLTGISSIRESDTMGKFSGWLKAKGAAENVINRYTICIIADTVKKKEVKYPLPVEMQNALGMEQLNCPMVRMPGSNH